MLLIMQREIIEKQSKVQPRMDKAKIKRSFQKKIELLIKFGVGKCVRLLYEPSPKIRIKL